MSIPNDQSTVSEQKAVLVEQRPDGVTLLRLNRPERMNALNRDLVGDLHDALETVRKDPECRVVILTGAGRGFCAGADLSGYGTPRGWKDTRELQLNFAVQRELSALITALHDLKVPAIAAVNGPASGGGMALALACDLRIVSTSAKFAVSFVKVGLSGCDMGVSWLLPRLIGAGRAFELLLTGRPVAAEEAQRVGLANRVVADDHLLDAALETAQLIVGNSPWGVSMTKEVMWSQLEIGSLRAGIDLENRTQVLSTYTGDVAEAMAAFQERRPPKWS